MHLNTFFSEYEQKMKCVIAVIFSAFLTVGYTEGTFYSLLLKLHITKRGISQDKRIWIYTFLLALILERQCIQWKKNVRWMWIFDLI